MVIDMDFCSLLDRMITRGRAFYFKARILTRPFMSTDNKPIILYPREYNLRGGEARSSVKGITHDGELVTIKLRVDGAIHTLEAAPSISSFAKTSMMESKQSCLASPDNGPQKPMGILIFIRCSLEENPRDPDKNYPTYYTSRWAYVLRTGHQPLTSDFRGDLPFIGMGRVVIDKRNRQIQTAKENMARLQRDKPEGWEDAYRRNEAILKDYRSFDYHLYGYLTEQESVFADEDEDALVAWMDKVMGNPEDNANHGIFFRIETEQDVIIKELVREAFPIYDTVFRRYQNGSELLNFFKTTNPDLMGVGRFSYRVMPIIKFAGKKIFKDSLKTQSDFEELEQTFYVNDEPLAMPLAVRIDKLDNKELLINKIHKTGASLGHPALLDISGHRVLRFDGVVEEQAPLFENLSDMLLMASGLEQGGSLQLATWYPAHAIDPESIVLPHEPLLNPMVHEDSAAALTPGFEAQTPLTHLVSVLDRVPDPEPSLSSIIEPSPRVQREPLIDDTIAPAVITDQESVAGVSSLDALSEFTLDEEIDLADAAPGALDGLMDVIDEATEGSADGGEIESEEPSLFGSQPLNFDEVTATVFDGVAKTAEESIPSGDLDHSDVNSQPDDANSLDSDIATEDEIHVGSLDSIMKTPVDDHPHDLNEPINPAHSAHIDSFSTWEEESTSAQGQGDDLSAWMDEDELVEGLNESPDAYSDETEADTPTVVTSPASEPVAPPVTPMPAGQNRVPTPEKPATSGKKGGLASFVRSRQQK
jgi:hypothetical protein